MPDCIQLYADPHAIVVMGVSGSGKTTLAHALAEQLQWQFLDADDFHTAQAKQLMASGIALSDAQREPWVDALGNELQRQDHAGMRTVLAFSGLRKAHRQRLRQCGVAMQFVYLQAKPQLVAARLQQRHGHFMPATLLDSQYAALQPPQDEPDVINLDLAGSPQAVLQRALALLRR